MAVHPKNQSTIEEVIAAAMEFERVINMAPPGVRIALTYWEFGEIGSVESWRYKVDITKPAVRVY